METGPQPGWWLASDGRWYPPELANGPAAVPELGGAVPAKWDSSFDQAPPRAPATFVTGAPTTPVDAPFVLGPEAGASKPKRRGLLVGAGITLAAVIALVAGLVGTSGSSRTTTSSGNAVLTSAQTTLAAKTADLHMNIAMQIPGAGPITATGDGTIDFANNASQIAVRYTGRSQLDGMQLTEVFVGQSLYLSMPQISQLVPGKSWLSEPVSASGSITPGSSNPAAMFQMLTNEGNTVTALGPSTIDGESVQGFRVVINPATLDNGLAHADLPPSVVQQVKSMFGAAGIQMSVFVGNDTHLLRRITFSMHLTVQSTSVSAQATEDISDYGTPVSISAPPASQVVSMQQFEQTAGAAAGAVEQ
jgi:hypothetical protein